ncbi:MAG TPA: TonB-dependent receptor [Bryobacteraceae bacterium]|nr:TonB-dependent receptor [Bryobacteraceae bacterium]
MSFRLLAGLLFLLFSFSPLQAQNNGILTGSVVDPSGAAVPNASIQLLLPGGTSPVLRTQTGSDGSFSLAAVKPGVYQLVVDLPGFTKVTLANVAVDPGKENTMPPIKLQIASASQSVEVTEGVAAVQSTSNEVATTLTQEQVAKLPVLDRQVTNLFSTQAGVSSAGLSSTVIDGIRSQATNVTLDGINVQDNFIRLSGLDFLPNQLTIAQVSEFTISSSNAPSNYGIGATQITLTTPSGTNQLHGSGYYYNRNSAVASADWFANQNGTGKPFLNLNQIGGTVGGPVIKDKLFFYLAYEAYRRRQTALQNNTVLTASARTGVLTLTDGTGRQANLLTATQNSIDPYMSKLLNTIPLPNNGLLGDGLNTGGYQFNASNNETRDNAQGRGDYILSPKNVFFGTYVWNRQIVDRSDLDTFYTKTPPYFNDNYAKLLSAGWRWNPTANLTNELRGGFNLSPGIFDVSFPRPAFYLSGGAFDIPAQNAFANQGRYTDTYSLQDNANLVRGNHTLSFGYQQQNVRVRSFDNNGGISPIYTLGFSANNPNGLSAIPGLADASANDVASANTLLATLAGIVSGYQQTFNVTSRTSGFVPFAPNTRRFQYDTYSGYVTDKWKVRRTLTLIAGLRYDYYTTLNERDSLFLTPEVVNNNYISTALSNATTDFAGNSVGRPYYHTPKKNFAPSAGFAWDVFGDGKTAVRGGYSLSYFNDDAIIAVQNYIGINAGLQNTVANGNVINQLTNNPPAVPTPTLKVPRTFLDNLNDTGPGNAGGIIDPGLRTPYVQQWSLGVQREIKSFVIDARYVGNHGLHEWRGIDFNQVQVAGTPYLTDFIKARNNLFLARKAGLGNDASYNPAVAGSVPLPFFDNNLPGGGFLSDPTVAGLIARGEAGQLGSIYQQVFVPGLNGGFSFFPSPYGLGMDALTSASYSTYHAAQIDVRRRLPNGQQLQINYTFSKSLSDANADLNNNRFEPYLDVHNGRLDKSRAPFDLTHCLKANYVVPIPLGNGHRLGGNSLVNHVIGDWTFSGFFTYQGGSPFSILSRRGTLNRGGSRATYNSVDLLSGANLSNAVGFFMTGNGPYFVNPSAIAANGRGVAPDGEAAFSGQVFANPDPGTYGLLQRRMFTGPNLFEWDAQLAKSIPLTERVRIDIQAAFFNLTNHPNFTVGQDGDSSSNNYNIENVNASNFGRIISTVTIPRLIQFGAYIRF